MAESKDYIVRATAAGQQLRVFACTTGGLVEKAREIHDLSPVAAAALGRLLTAGSMMGCMMKGDKDVLTLQIECGGPIGGITVTADSAANVKGYVKNPQVMLPPNSKGKLDVSGAVGPGFLNVIRDIGMKEPYNGQTHLVSGEIAEDLTYYFAASEQIPTSVALGVLMEKNNTVKHAGGFIIQLMPFAEERIISDLETRLKGYSSITSLMDKGMTPKQMMQQLFDGYDVNYTTEVTPAYHCDCSKERVYKAVMSIGKKDIEEMIADGEPIRVECHFCNKSYTFDTDDLKSML